MAMAVCFRSETCNAGSVRKRSNKKGRQTFEIEAPSESAGQLLSLEDQERAGLARIMSEMGHTGGHKGGRSAPRSRRQR